MKIYSSRQQMNKRSTHGASKPNEKRSKPNESEQRSKVHFDVRTFDSFDRAFLVTDIKKYRFAVESE